MVFNKKNFKFFAFLMLYFLAPIFLVAWRITRMIALNSKKIMYSSYIKIYTLVMKLRNFKSDLNKFSSEVNIREEYDKVIVRIDKKLLTLDGLDWIRMFLAIFVMVIPYIPLKWIEEIMSGYLKYIIMCIFLYFFTDGSRLLGTLSKKIWITTLIIIISLILVFPTWFILFYAVLKNIDFGLVVITALFCFLPSYNLTMIMLNIIKNALVRIVIATLFIIVVGAYTLMIFGTYDLKVDGLIDQYLSHNFIEYASAAIHYGWKQFSQESLATYKGKSIYHLMQFAFGIYGGLVFARVTKIALANVEENN